MRWGYFRTRKQFMLSRFPDSWRVFFAQPPGGGAEDPWTPRREGNVTYFTVPFLKPATGNALYNAIARAAPGRALIERAALVQLRSRLRTLGVDPKPVLMASNIYAALALEQLPHRAAFWDYNDNPFQFAGVPEWAAPYWPRATRTIDALFVVSEFYREKLAKELTVPIITIGNGAETAHFETARPIPADLAALPRPRIGYLGLLSHFLDFDTLEALRAARRGGTLVLIGPPGAGTAAAIDALQRREGVAVLGPRPYEQVPAYMQGLDACVIPFRAHDPYVRGINPNKVYQYLASGRPVVTTPLPDLDPVPPLLQYASEPAAFADAVGRALDARPDPDACRGLARPHDWGRLAARMVTEIEQRLPTG